MRTLILFLLLAISNLVAQPKEIVVVIPSYNNIECYEKNLESVCFQQYDNFRVIYIDDCSVDGTGDAVERYIKEHNLENKVTLIKNKKRRGALANLYDAIHSCDDHEIIINLDGDDWFKHENALTIINNAYTDSNVWLTYGQYEFYPSGKLGRCRSIPQEAIDNASYREYEWVTSAPRTFYAWLFKKIEIEDLLYEGAFFPVAWDLAFMFPMLEMSGGKFKFIADVVYVYNWATPYNDEKIHKGLQRTLDCVIRGRRKYKRL